MARQTFTDEALRSIAVDVDAKIKELNQYSDFFFVSSFVQSLYLVLNEFVKCLS